MVMDKDSKETVCTVLETMCQFFDNPDNWKYNTFHIHQALANGEMEAFNGIPELAVISEYLMHIKTTIEVLGNEKLEKE